MLNNIVKTLTLSPILFLPPQVSAQTTSTPGSGSSPIKDIDPGTGWATDIGTVINFALSFVMGVALLLVFFYLIWGGIQWITSGGDKSKTEEARNKITAAVIGIIILAAAFALVQFVAWILGFDGIESAIRDIGTIDG